MNITDTVIDLNSINFTNIKFTREYIFRDVIGQICYQWNDFTLNIHITYIRFMIFWIIIGYISKFWKPVINFYRYVEFYNPITKKTKQIKIGLENFDVMFHLQYWITLFIFGRILIIFYYKYYYIPNNSFMQVLNIILRGKG